MKPIFNIKLREKRCVNYEFILFLRIENFSLCPVKLKKLEVRFAASLRGGFSSLQATFFFYVPFHSSLFMPLCHVFSQFLGVDSFSFFRSLLLPSGLFSSQSLVSLLFRLSLIFLFPYLTSTR